MSFFSNIKKIFSLNQNSATQDAKRRKLSHNIRYETNPLEFWELIGELGDGAFGKVHKVSQLFMHLFCSFFASFYLFLFFCFVFKVAATQSLHKTFCGELVGRNL